MGCIALRLGQGKVRGEAQAEAQAERYASHSSVLSYCM